MRLLAGSTLGILALSIPAALAQVRAGGELRVRAGQRLVVEAWDAKAPAYFSWDPLPVRVQFD